MHLLTKKNLFNISIGKAASIETKQSLITIETTGTEMRDLFISECCKDPFRFQQLMKRNVLRTFASEDKVTRLKN